uniref:Tudor domain-containing protein n=1 Tax=Macrostomum lignano TaxID=282301 RepID=A0A1I8FNG6_9PLAT
MLQQSHVFNFLCMDTPSTVDPNSDGLPTEFRLACPDFVRLNESTGEVTVLPRAQAGYPRQSRQSLGQSVGQNSTVVGFECVRLAIEHASSRARRDRCHRMRLRPYWPAFGSLIYCGTAVGASAIVYSCDTCTVLLIDSGEEYKHASQCDIRNHRQINWPLCRPWPVPCRLLRRYSGRRPALDSHLRRGDCAVTSPRREYFAHMLRSSRERGAPQQRLLMQRRRKQRLAAVGPVAVQQRWPVQPAKQHAAPGGACPAIPLRPVPPEPLNQRLAEALQENFCGKKRDEKFARLRRRGGRRHPRDALKVFQMCSRTDRSDISAAKEDATPQQMQRQQPNIADEPNSDDEFELNEEFLLKPSDEDGDWGFVSVTAEAAYSKPEAEVEAEPASGGGGGGREPEPRSGKQNRNGTGSRRRTGSGSRSRSGSGSRTGKQNRRKRTTPLSAFSVRPLGDQFRWPNIQVGPLREPIQAKLSHLDCSDERMVIYMQRSDERSEGLLTALRHALHTVYSAVSYAQYDFDVLGRWCSSLTESGAARSRVCLTTYVREQGPVFLLDFDTGYSKVMPTGNMRPVFNCEGLTDPSTSIVTRSRDWRPYQKTIGALLTSSAKLRVYICNAKHSVRPPMSCCLRSIVLLPDNREISQELIDGLAVALIGTRKLFKMAYRFR